MPSGKYVVQDLPPHKMDGSGGGTPSSKGRLDRRLGLLLWKNLLLRRRHWIVTLLEILLPTFIAILLAFMRTQIVDENKTVMNTTTIYPIQPEAEILSEARRHLFKKKSFFGYVPQNNLTLSIMEKMAKSINAKRMELKGFDTEEELENFVEEKELESAKNFVQKLTAAIVFGPSFLSGNAEDLSKNPAERLQYSIRLPLYTIDTKSSFPWLQFSGPSDDNAYSYVNGGFSGLQILMDKILINLLTAQNVSHDINHQVFPYPPFVRNKGFEQINSVFVPLFMIIGFIFIVPSIIIKVVSERETGIKELMKIMGLPNYLHWLGWMVNSLIVLCISITLVIFLFFYTFSDITGPVLPNSDPTVWWFVLFLYVIAATSYCFFISVLSDKPTTATALGIVTWLVLYLGMAIPMEQNLQNLTLQDKLASCLFPNMALHWAIKAMYSFETRGVGARWSTVFKATSPIDGLALYQILIMFIIDTVIFVTLTIYLENILPSKYGIRKPFYYIFQRSTWCSDDTPKSVQTRRASLAAPIDKPGFEKEPIRLKAGVAIQNLKKVFGKKRAVDGVSIKMYEGQITALVGHNGAGKTTTLSILTGLFPPTSGTAAVNGYDIQSEMDKVRESLGLCPQHNMLFDKLTVWEHLILFGRLKGLTFNEASKDGRNLIKKLHLEEKTHYMSCELSGGQKRKLSLGMALIGGSKVVILDECTSGMDPEARRVIWDLLLELRGERTIILTTHFMEEADILGDRIAMMASGKIKCCGTPLFLKKYYGTGYTLKLTTNGGDKGNKEILNVCQSFIPQATMGSNDNNNETNGNVQQSNGNGYNKNGNDQSEISISVPSDEKTLAIFPSLFSKLNEDKDSLGITTIGLSLSTIDQVFLKIGELEAAAEAEANGIVLPAKPVNHSNGKDANANGMSKKGEEKGVRRPQRIFSQQVIGMFQKKLIYTFRKRKLLISQFIMPPLLLIAAIALSTKAYVPASTSPPLTMNLTQFTTAVTYYTAEPELGNIYKSLVGSSAVPIDAKNDLVEELIKVADEDLGEYRDQYLIAAYLNSTFVNAMYNSIPYHSAPISMNLVTNSILKSLSPKEKNYSIEVSYHPLENKLFAVLQAAQPNPAFTVLVPIVFGALVPIGLALFAASYVVFPTEERLSNSKQLQLMTGVSPLTYWGTSFVWDFLVMAVAICVMVACFPIFEINNSFSAYGGLTAFMGILLIYGYSTILFSYLFSLFVPSSAFGFAWITILHVITGMIVPIFMFFVDNANLTTAALPIRYFFRLFSSFGASMSIMRFAAIATSNSRCAILTDREKDYICDPKYQVDVQLRQCCDNCANLTDPEHVDTPPCFEPEKFFTWNYTYTSATDAKRYTIPGIEQEILWIVIMALVYKILIFLFESGFIHKMCASCCRCFGGGTSKSLDAQEKAEGYEVDEDVALESDRVSKMTKSEDALVVCDLSKNYGGFAAVREINFGVHYGECFGLLGVNGAGKTTTFRMLTGDENMSSGNAFSFMNTLKSNKRDFMANMGYCPQTDSIIGALTGREMLQLFCRLRGVPSGEIKSEVNKWLLKLGLEKSGDAPCGRYSGGMKRRLSIGISMIGDPPVVLLDEPTSGVDPVSRRQFWDVIDSAKALGQSVILTSHSMDEIEVLCSRLGIMVNGRLQCMGSVEYLRSKFAKGYTLVVRLKGHHAPDSPIICHLKSEIAERFEPCELQDEHQNILQYQLMDSKLPWDMIFRHMEDVKNLHIPAVPEVITETSRRNSLRLLIGEDGPTYSCLIEDYTVSLTSLEEVFLSFARKQYSDRNAQTSALGQILMCKCCSS